MPAINFLGPRMLFAFCKSLLFFCGSFEFEMFKLKTCSLCLICKIVRSIGPGDDDNDPGIAKAKAKAKGASRKRQVRALTNQEAGGNESMEAPEKSKRSRVDKEAKARLAALKLQTDMVHMELKWTSRIKSLNVEVTASLAAAQPFPILAPSFGFASSQFLFLCRL